VTDPGTDPLARLAALEGVSSAMAAARDGIDALLRDRGLRRTSPEMTAESLLLGAHASAQLEGSTALLDEVRVGRGGAEAKAALRVNTELLGHAPVLTSSPLQAWARISTVACKGVVPDAELGRPRSPDSARRLTSLGAMMVRQTSAPALVVAAVVHADLLAASAFAARNGIVARAVERLVLVARGVDPRSLLVPEAGHLALRREYESNLGAYRDGGLAGVRAWLLYAAEAYAAGAEASPLRRS
jgi:hypothetical protein